MVHDFIDGFAIALSLGYAVHGLLNRMGPHNRKPMSSAVIFSKGFIAALCICVVVSSPSKAAEDSPLKIGAPLDSLKMTELHDSFNEIRNGHRHEAIDIMRPRGTPVRAVSDGVIRKVFISRQGGLTIYEFDRDSAYCFYYAHLDRYADQIHEGGPVARGDLIGYVGTTGDAAPDAPQLHFAIFKLAPRQEMVEGRGDQSLSNTVASVIFFFFFFFFFFFSGFAGAKLSEVRSSRQ